MLRFRCLGWLLVAVVATAGFSEEAKDTKTLASPNGDFQFTIALKRCHAHYQVAYQGKPVITPSPLGFQMKDGAMLGSRVVAIEASGVSENDTTWEPVYGERRIVRDRYTRQVFTLKSKQVVAMSVEVRCYDEGVAFCYHVKPKDPNQSYRIDSERTAFAFAADHTTWTTKSAQGNYTKTTISGMEAVYDRPQIFLSEEDKIYIAIGEARLVDFARMKLVAAPDRQHVVMAALSSDVEYQGDLRTPWRFIMAAKRPGTLLENNDLVLNLNDPCKIADTSWIKPGKVLREVTLSTEGGIACVDYAAANGIEYVLFDAGWYGHEYQDSADATTITVDRKRSTADLDLHQVIAYAKQRDIGIILYVNRRALEKQLDDILPLYQKWGIAGVKYGFVQVGSQRWTTWLHEAVRKAAEHQLMVDVHDEYRPTGVSRTYPNLMTQEGIGGDETRPTPKKSLGMFFPRFLAGAADNTVCYYDGRVAKYMNHAFQLAKTVCFYSPWQFIHWYDRPQASPGKTDGAGGSHRTIGDEPELAFFAHVPTVWDDTRVLEGRIEEYAVVARRSGDAWYIGAMNAEEPRVFTVKLDFLKTGTAYTLHSYTHDEQVPTRTKVKIDKQPVDASTTLKIDLQANDGAAYRIVPQDTQ